MGLLDEMLRTGNEAVRGCERYGTAAEYSKQGSMSSACEEFAVVDEAAREGWLGTEV